MIYRPPPKFSLEAEVAAALTRVRGVRDYEVGPLAESTWRLLWRGYEYLGAASFYYVFGRNRACVASSRGFCVDLDAWVHLCVRRAIDKHHAGVVDDIAEPRELHTIADVDVYLTALAAFEDATP